MTQNPIRISRKSGLLRSVPDSGPPRLPAIIDEFCRRYPNAKTAFDYRSSLRRLFAHAGVDHPAHLTEGDLLAYCTAGNPANNTVYQRTTKVLAFLRWCEYTGLVERKPFAVRHHHRRARQAGLAHVAPHDLDQCWSVCHRDSLVSV
jgi:hypothetical protein